MSTSRIALIVGAGIGGLATGLALRRAGWSIRIFERAATPRELGFALLLAPNARAALDELGLGDAVAAEGILVRSWEIRRPDGAPIRRFEMPDLADRDRPVVALRQVLHGALLQAVGDDALALTADAIGFDTAATGVTLRLADGSTATGDILVGADGVASVIRRLMHPQEPPPRASGLFALRGVAYGVAQHLDTITGTVYFGDGIEIGVARASADAVYWYASLLADAVTSGPRDARSVLERCTAGFDPRFCAIAAATKPDDLRLDELFDRAPLERWGTGRVTLLGDAAHPMLPHAGQGAAQALEDAVGLALALRWSGDRELALRRYERVRAARTRDMVNLGRRISRITTTRSRTVSALRNTAVRYVPQELALRSAKLGGQRDPNRELRER